MALDPTLITTSGSYTGDPASFTLSDLDKWGDAPQTLATIDTMYKNMDILTRIPMQTRDGVLEMKVKRFTGKSKPRVDHMPFNEDPFGTKATPEDYVEKIHLIENFIDYDRRLIRAKNLTSDPRTQLPKIYMKSMAEKNNDYFINNDPFGYAGTGIGDILAPQGIKARLYDTNNPVPSDMKINAGVDISTTSAALGTNALNLTFFIDTMLSSQGNQNGDGVLILGNAMGKNAFNMALKAINAGGGFSTTKDNYDRVTDTYRSAEIMDLGRKWDEVTPVVGYENADGTPNPAGKYTSLYFVKTGPEDFHGWHWGPPGWENLGRIDNGITERMMFEYLYGFLNAALRSLGRIFGIKVIAG